MKDFKIALISISCALIGILPIIYKTTDEKSINSDNNYFNIIVIVIVIFLVIAFLGKDIIVLSKKIIEKNYTNFIYEHYKSTIEFIDLKGEKVSLNTAIRISKLGIFSRRNTTIETLTEGFGSVHPENGIGINVKILQKSEEKLVYSTDFRKNNIINKQNYIDFSQCFLNSFNQKGCNYFTIGPKHHCEHYEFEFIYPKIDSNITLNFERGIKATDLSAISWEIDHDVTYSTYTRYGKRVAKVLYYNIPNDEARKIIWDIN